MSAASSESGLADTQSAFTARLSAASQGRPFQPNDDHLRRRVNTTEQVVKVLLTCPLRCSNSRTEKGGRILAPMWKNGRSRCSWDTFKIDSPNTDTSREDSSGVPSLCSRMHPLTEGRLYVELTDSECPSADEIRSDTYFQISDDQATAIIGELQQMSKPTCRIVGTTEADKLHWESTQIRDVAVHTVGDPTKTAPVRVALVAEPKLVEHRNNGGEGDKDCTHRPLSSCSYGDQKTPVGGTTGLSRTSDPEDLTFKALRPYVAWADKIDPA